MNSEIIYVFFSVDKLYIKNILTLLENYIIGLSNIQQKKRIKWVERFVVTLNLVFISCGNNYLTPEKKKHISTPYFSGSGKKYLLTLSVESLMMAAVMIFNEDNRGGSRIRGGGGAHLKKLGRAEGGAKDFEVFRVKNHDFTPQNHIFSNFAPPPGSDPGQDHTE